MAKKPRLVKIPTREDFESYRGGHTFKKWRTLPAAWHCPACGRTPFELLTWTRSKTGYGVPVGEYQWLAPLHEHHDHRIDGYAIAPRFVATLICSDCNHAEGRAKRHLHLPKWFSFSPGELRSFVIGSWVVNEDCRVVLVTGLSGVGKTDLATCLGRGGNQAGEPLSTLATGIHGCFDRVIWRSLINATPPGELFDDLLDFLSIGHNQSPTPVAQQIESLLQCLQEKRSLLILDNVEAILRSDDPLVNYREGYEPYGRFFELAGKTAHQSCLLLTSREKPRAISELQRSPVKNETQSFSTAVACCQDFREETGTVTLNSRVQLSSAWLLSMSLSIV